MFGLKVKRVMETAVRLGKRERELIRFAAELCLAAAQEIVRKQGGPHVDGYRSAWGMPAVQNKPKLDWSWRPENAEPRIHGYWRRKAS